MPQIPSHEVVAGPRDVLFGRGRGIYESRGNVFFREMLTMYLPQYAMSDKRQKTKIATEIVEHVKRNKGRFLKQKVLNGKFAEVSDHEARVKVTNAFSHQRRAMQRSMFPFGFFNGNLDTQVPAGILLPQANPEQFSNRTEATDPMASFRSDRAPMDESSTEIASKQNLSENAGPAAMQVEPVEGSMEEPIDAIMDVPNEQESQAAGGSAASLDEIESLTGSVLALLSVDSPNADFPYAGSVNESDVASEFSALTMKDD